MSVPREPDATIRQLLTHTSGSRERPDLLAAARTPGAVVAHYSYVPGGFVQRNAGESAGAPGHVRLGSRPEHRQSRASVRRHAECRRCRAIQVASGEARNALCRVQRNRVRQSSYPESSSVLSPSSGLVTTVRDLAKFDLALKQGILLRRETLAQAWTAPADADGAALPHGVGWYVQYYNGEKVVWQYGLAQNAASALMITLPSRDLTLILLANSEGLTGLYSPANGDVRLSPFARVFLNMFVR